MGRSESDSARGWRRRRGELLAASALLLTWAAWGCEPDIPEGKDLNLKGGYGAYCVKKRHCRMGFYCKGYKCQPLNRRVLEGSVTKEKKKSYTYRYTGVGAKKVGKKCSSNADCGKRLFCNRSERVCVPRISCRRWARRIRQCREALWERANPNAAKSGRRGRRHRRAVKKNARAIRESLIGRCKKHRGRFSFKGGRFIAACLSQKSCQRFAKCMFSKPE